MPSPSWKAALGVALEIAELRQRVGQPRHRRPRQAGMQREVGVRQRAAAVAERGQHVEPMRQRGREGGIGLVLRRSGRWKDRWWKSLPWSKIGQNSPILSIYRNEFANRVDIRLRFPKKREATWISIFPVDRKHGGRSCRPSSIRKCCRATAPGLRHVAKGEAAPFMGDLQQQGARGRAVESRPSRTRRRRTRHAAFQSRICAAGGNHGPAVLGA